MLKRSVLALSALLSLPAMAAWQLDDNASSLNFITTKNSQVTEVHQFTELAGRVDDEGMLTLTVPLSSVDTGIDIRNTRMQEMLFEVANFAEATYTAEVPEALLESKPGKPMKGDVSGELSLHGKTAPVSFNVMVTRLDESTLQVSTVRPALIKAEDFGLTKGVEALQEVAKLKSITTTVPVTFSATFFREGTE